MKANKLFLASSLLAVVGIGYAGYPLSKLVNKPTSTGFIPITLVDKPPIGSSPTENGSPATTLSVGWNLLCVLRDDVTSIVVTGGSGTARRRIGRWLTGRKIDIDKLRAVLGAGIIDDHSA